MVSREKLFVFPMGRHFKSFLLCAGKQGYRVSEPIEVDRHGSAPCACGKDTEIHALSVGESSLIWQRCSSKNRLRVAKREASA